MQTDSEDVKREVLAASPLDVGAMEASEVRLEEGGEGMG